MCASKATYSNSMDILEGPRPKAAVTHLCGFNDMLLNLMRSLYKRFYNLCASKAIYSNSIDISESNSMGISEGAPEGRGPPILSVELQYMMGRAWAWPDLALEVKYLGNNFGGSHEIWADTQVRFQWIEALEIMYTSIYTYVNKLLLHG